MSLKQSEKRLDDAQAALDAGAAEGMAQALNPPPPLPPTGGVVGFTASTTPNNLKFKAYSGPSDGRDLRD